MEQLARIYEAVHQDEITFFICAIIAGWLLLAALAVLIPPIARRPSGSKFIAMTPNALATLGILGTFTGILVGLLDFDVNKIDASVPTLLAGLKIAFTTSIVGIAAALAFRLLRAFAPVDATTEGVGPEEIHRALIELRDDGRIASNRSAEQLGELRRAIASEGDGSLLTQIQKLRTSVQDGQTDLLRGLTDFHEESRSASSAAIEQLGELRKAISSDGDGSLLTQLEKLRSTMRDGQTEFIREFREFATHMVENHQKAVIQALEQVIRDFNANLTEQFGENFKQLNAAVHSLVVWQDKYREHVEALEERHRIATTALEAAQRALQEVQTHSERIPEAIKKLEPILTGITAQTTTLGAHLDAVAALRERAIEAFPVIEANLEKITTGLTASVDEALTHSQKALADASKTQTELQRGYDAFLKDAGDARELFAAELATALTQMSEQTSREFARHGELIEQSSADAQRVIRESWEKNVKQLNEQFNTFDQQMQQELTRALQALGSNLASVSEKLVSDYTPLVARLRELVEVSRRVN